jgi:hypothetical protein
VKKSGANFFKSLILIFIFSSRKQVFMKIYPLNKQMLSLLRGWDHHSAALHSGPKAGR